MKSLKKGTIEKSRKKPWILVGERSLFPTRGDLYLWIFVLLVGTLLLLPWGLLRLHKLRVGDIAFERIEAPVDFQVENAKATEELIRRTVEGVKPIFNLNPTWVNEASDKVSTLFSELRLSYDRSNVSLDRKKIKNTLGVNLPTELVRTLRMYRYEPWIEDLITNLLFKLGDYWILREDLPFPSSRLTRGFLVKDLQLSREFESREAKRVYSAKEVGHLVRRLAVEEVPYRRAALRDVIIVLLNQLVRPNFFYDKKATKERIQMAVGRVKPIFYQVKKGEVIVREGERITPEVMLKLEALKRRGGNKEPWILVPGLLFSVALVLFLFTLSWFRLYRGRIEPSVSYRIALLTMLFFLILQRWFLFLSIRLPGPFPWLKGVALLYVVPFAFPGVFISFLFHLIPSLVLLAGLLCISALLPHVSASYLLVFLVAFLTGGVSIKRGKGEGTILKAVVLSILVSLSLVASLHLFPPGDFLVDKLWTNLLVVVVSGLLSLLLVFACVPLTEVAFGVATDMKLLSLINLDHPLMRRLLENAPGTYNHSMNVATMAEAAAQVVDANPLLAKAGAYFHDIGKLKNPGYFIENTEGTSRHEKLSPTVSRLVLISHVKDGLEMAKKYKLPKAIGDVIQQHQGTSLIYYFYHKAKESCKECEIKEEDFRYPGPKPKTKEAAIVMMADAVEAAARTLEDPTPSRIRGLVSEIINNIFLDGQLEECELTLRDIYRIMEAFSKILIATYHKRVEYPERS